MGKVRFGIKNAHYAVWNKEKSAYDTPVAIPGSVKLSLDAKGNSSTFYADDIAYEQFSTNGGYTGSLQVAVAEDKLLKELLGYLTTTNGVVVEDTSAKQASFALLFEVEGNESNVRFALYNCKFSRPSTENNTTTEDTTPDTTTLDITCIGRTFGGHNLVKGHCEMSSETKTTFDGWFNSVVMPSFNSAVVPVESISLDKATVSVAAGSNVMVNATVRPETATNQTITANSADGSKATASVSGKTVTIHGVAATGAGKTVAVTVSAGGQSTTCAVTVTANAGA